MFLDYSPLQACNVDIEVGVLPHTAVRAAMTQRLHVDGVLLLHISKLCRNFNFNNYSLIPYLI